MARALARPGPDLTIPNFNEPGGPWPWLDWLWSITDPGRSVHIGQLTKLI